MAKSVQFSIDDTSPTITYFPFSDTFSSLNLSAGWNPYFVQSGFASSIGQTGVGESQHITSRGGASISISWHGTSIQLFGNTSSFAKFSLTLDGASVDPSQTDPANNLLASLDGLPDTNHTLGLTTIIPEGQLSLKSPMLVFDKAVVTSPPPADLYNIIFTDHLVDDTDILFSGSWSFLPSSDRSAVHQSEADGDKAQVTFSGISVRIFGTTSPQAGNYSVILDDIQSPIFSARSSFSNPNTLLFYTTGLDANTTHHITLINHGGLLQLKSGGFEVFSSNVLPTSPPPTESPGATAVEPQKKGKAVPVGAIVGAVIGGLAILLFFLVGWWCVWKKRRNQMREAARKEGPGILTVGEGLLSVSPFDTMQATTPHSGRRSKQPQRRGTDLLSGSRPDQTLSPGLPTTSTNAPPRVPRRETDGGPMREEDTDELETLPPEYEDVFRRGRRSVVSAAGSPRALPQVTTVGKG